MAILEKEVWVNLVSPNVKFYENRGYEIPKYTDKYGTIRKFKTGSKLLVKVSDLPLGSDVEVTKICDDCGCVVGKTPYGNIIKSRQNGDGKDRCKRCSIIKRALFQKNNVKYENSLEFWAKENKKEYLIAEYMSINEKLPSQIIYGSHCIASWKCVNCRGEYRTNINKRTTGGTNCPYCAGLKVLKGFNDLFTTYPKIANMLVDKNLGYKITAGSSKSKVDFKCSDCNYIMKNKMVNDAVRRGLHCPRCGDGISYPEKFMLSVLEQTKLQYETQKTFGWSDRKRYDFYIKSFNLIIEIHGEQHYKYTGFKNSLKQVQENDRIKRELALTNGIKHYIVIDARESTMSFIRKSIECSDLINFVDLSVTNWENCNKYACSSLIKTASELWNNGIKSTSKIGEIIRIVPSNVIKYLKIGAEMGWCDYNAIIGGANGKTVLQLSFEGKLIKEWETARKASKCLNIGYSEISSACRKKIKSAGGFMWVFKDDFIENENCVTPYKRNSTGKPIVKLDINGNFIATYESITEAIGKKSPSKINKITQVCKGERDSYDGFKWLYKSDYKNQLENNPKILE